MKLIDHFRTFLKDTVNLNATRVQNLEKSITSLESFIKNSTWEPEFVGFEAHGSWAHKTIIKPLNDRPFDADVLVNIKEVSGWEPGDYINELARVLRADGTYKDKVSTSSHCVTINYAGERKVDIAPCLINRGGWVRQEVCNRITGEFETTAPTAYTNWLIEANGITGFNSFRKVTRLVKYLRDHKTTFTCSSVVLTTLLASQVYSSDKDSDEFADTPTALKTIFGRLDSFLQSLATKPVVANPSLPTEDFAASWTDDQFRNFKDMVNKYRGWIDDAYDTDTRDESVVLWRKIFGEDFASSITLEEGKSVSAVARQKIVALAKSTTSLASDLVALVLEFGRKALPPGFDSLAYKHEPEWFRAHDQFPVRIVATLHRTQQAPALSDVESLDAVPKGHVLWFDVRDMHGQPLPIATYRVQWRITNTDEEAYANRCMRGEFNPPQIGNRRWENLAFRGVHQVEAFVIRRSDNHIVAESEPFYVTIE